MAKWRYPSYLPKPPHEMTDFDWQSYKTGLSKDQMSERYSGITSDLIPAFEQIQAQGLGDINPDPYKRVSPFGPAAESKSIPEIFYPNDNTGGGQEQAKFPNSQASVFRNDNASLGTSRLPGDLNDYYGRAKKIIDRGRAVVDGVRRVGDFIEDTQETVGEFVDDTQETVGDVVEDTLGTKEDPSGIRLGLEWLTGTGPKERHLGENSRMAAAIKRSPGVREGRETLYKKYNGRLKDGDSYVDYPFTFTWEIARRTYTFGEQFIGSFNLDMHVRNGRIHFEARNRTSIDSLLFGTARRERGQEELPTWETGPMGNKYRYISWSEPLVQRL